MKCNADLTDETSNYKSHKYSHFSHFRVSGWEHSLTRYKTGQYKLDLMCDGVTEFITIVSNISPHHFNHS